MKDEKVTLLEQREQIYNEIKKTHRKYEYVNRIFCEIKLKYEKQKFQFEKIDRDLAMIDGRYKIVAKDKRQKKQGELKLTKEQIINIANQLGVSISIEGEMNEDEMDEIRENGDGEDEDEDWGDR